MKRIITIFLCVIFLFIIPFTAYADDNKGESVAITVVIPQVQQKKEEAPTIPKKPNYLYPVNVTEIEENGWREIVRTYELGTNERPDNISREPFTRNGWLYELAEITKNETSSNDRRKHTEIITLDTNTKDTEAILKLLMPEIEFKSTDGYTGVLILDISSIKIETAGTKSSSYAINATREYPHLSSNDTALIPKTITENGRTLTLSNIQWKTQNYSTVDYDQIPDSYTAVATYTGTAYQTVVTGYITTAGYHGELSKNISGKTVYTAYFIGVPIVSPIETAEAPSIVEPETTIVTAEAVEIQTEEPIIIDTSTESVIITEPITEPLTEAVTEIEKETEIVKSEIEEEANNDDFNILPVIIAVLAGLIIGSGLVFLYLKKFKKSNQQEDNLNEDEENID